MPSTRIRFIAQFQKIAGRFFLSGSDAGAFALHRLAAAAEDFPLFGGSRANAFWPRASFFLSALRLIGFLHSSFGFAAWSKRTIGTKFLAKLAKKSKAY